MYADSADVGVPNPSFRILCLSVRCVRVCALKSRFGQLLLPSLVVYYCTTLATMEEAEEPATDVRASYRAKVEEAWRKDRERPMPVSRQYSTDLVFASGPSIR